MRILISEHGETNRDARGLVHGRAHADEPLNARGVQQSLRLGERLKRLRPPIIYTSPATRAEQTGRIAGAVAGIPVRTSAALSSLNTGSIGGGNQEAVARRLIPFARNPAQRVPGGESINGWRNAHLAFMRRIAAAAKAKGQRPPLFVTHSNVVGSVAGGSPTAAIRAMAHPPAAATPIRVSIHGAGSRSKP